MVHTITGIVAAICTVFFVVVIVCAMFRPEPLAVVIGPTPYALPPTPIHTSGEVVTQ